MASFSSSIHPVPHVLDTSVAINLEASGVGDSLLSALSRPVIIVDIIPGELDGGRGHGVKVQQALATWQREGLVTVNRLSSGGFDIYETLIFGDGPSTLDDGEAATIAHAIDMGAVAVIDEAKARRISADRYPALQLASSVDLMLDTLVISALGSDAISEALFNALFRARMRVPPERLSEVVDLLGKDRAALCHSLPASVRSR